MPRLLDRARGESMKKGDCPQIPKARREDFVPKTQLHSSEIQLEGMYYDVLIRGVQWLGSSFQQR